MMKKCAVLFMLFAVIYFLPGCKLLPEKVSIQDREDVIVVGVDEADEGVELTIVTRLVEPVSQDSSGSTRKVAIYTGYGETIFDAVRKLHSYTSKNIFWGHMDFIIVGEDTAKKGIGKYIDYFARDHELRIVSKLAIAQGATAADFIKRTNFPSISLDDRLDSLFSDVGTLSQSKEVALFDYMHMTNCAWGSLYLPCIQMVDFMEKDVEDQKYMDVQLNGYAIFDDDKLIGIVNDKMARGINWVTNEMLSGVIVAEDENGNKISLEIISSDCKIEPDYSRDIPSAKIQVEFTTNIEEYQGKDDIFHDDIIAYIVDQQNNIVKREIEKSIRYLQRKKSDILGIGNALYHKYPVKCDGLGDSWNEVFYGLDISVEVNSRINRSYNIKQPIGNKGEEE